MIYIEDEFGFSDIHEIIKGVVYKTLEEENFNKDVEVNIIFTKDDEIRELNRKYRQIDSVTDVLSFPMIDENGIEYNTLGEAVLGDIAVNILAAKRQAVLYGHSFKRELCFLIVHSMLHLLGYDHMTFEEEKIMNSKQEKILELLGIKR